MKPKVIKHLSNIEIDEISLVDRGANQHATVAIAKRAPEEENMPELYNEDGELLDEYNLEDGDIVFDAEGNAYQFEADEAGEYAEDGELAEVGKRGVSFTGEGAMKGVGLERHTSRAAQAVRDMKRGYKKPNLANGALYKDKNKRRGQSLAIAQDNFGIGYRNESGAKLSEYESASAKAGRLAGLGVENPVKVALGATGAAGAAYGGKKGYDHMKKSFSEEVMEELSKAYSDEERDEVLSKALGQVEELLAEQAEAVEIAKSERELRLTNEYIAKAAEYNVPVAADELGPVLYRMAEYMDYDDCMVIHKALSAAGSALFDEVGYVGGGDNADVLTQVSAVADEYIGKSAGLSREEALESVFESNPGAYDEYLAQRRGY